MADHFPSQPEENYDTTNRPYNITLSTNKEVVIKQEQNFIISSCESIVDYNKLEEGSKSVNVNLLGELKNDPIDNSNSLNVKTERFEMNSLDDVKLEESVEIKPEGREEYWKENIKEGTIVVKTEVTEQLHNGPTDNKSTKNEADIALLMNNDEQTFKEEASNANLPAVDENGIHQHHCKRNEILHSRENMFYSCTLCGKSFTRTDSLKNHIFVHSGEKPHSCIVCGKSFNQVGNLNVHMLVHSGEKPHSCTVCGKSFTHSSSLKQHGVVHSGERPHLCTVCGKSFTQFGSLKHHGAVHSGERPHLCTVCGKSFKHNGGLKQHGLVHSGRKPHSCTICGRSFAGSSSMKKHEKLHCREKPY